MSANEYTTGRKKNACSTSAMLRHILFDWGNTLMRDFGMPGPMASWPRLELLPGAEALLRTLNPTFTLYVATNAAESDATLVRQALDRCQIGEYFQIIFTSKELQANKPEPLFYARILEILACSPAECLMIGDSIVNDIIPAASVGMHTILFAEGQRRHEQLLSLPAHTAVAEALDEIPDILEQMQSL